MKNLLLFLPLLFLLSCKEQAKQPETPQSPTAEAGWTKPAVYAVDAPTTYYDDIEDEDFSEYSKLIFEVLKQVHAGKLTAYNYVDGKPLSAEEAKKKTVWSDTVFVDNPNPPFDTEMKVIVTDITEKVASVKVKETWRFNKETLQLEKKVLGIAPRVAIYDNQTGELRGHTPLFWVFFDKQAEENFKKQFNL